MIAANMFEQQLEADEIAAILNVAAQTVRAWRRRFEALGRDGLRASRHKGRPSRLNDERRTTLARMLLRTPAECGFDKYLWTQQLIADLIRREFGVSYHHDHVGVILREMGFTHQKPMRRARERDEAKIEAWRQGQWPALLKKAGPPAGSS